MSIQHLGLYSRFFVLFTSTTLLLVVFIILGVFAMSEDEAKQIVLERHQQLFAMMTDVATPPVDIEKLKVDAKKNRVQIQINSGTKRWHTSQELPLQDELLVTAEKLGSLYFTRHGSKYYLLAEKNNSWIIITSQIANLIIYPSWLVYWPWLIVALILFVSYRLLIGQLKPIKAAIDSAKQISAGNFEYKISHHPKNDLAKLTHGLDTMADELNKLFSAKDDLLLAVSHELRSPMARMKVSFALLEQNEIVQRLDKDLNQMDVILGQLLESARLQQSNKALHIDTYFLPNFINEVIEEHESRSRLVLDGEVPEIAVAIDNGRIKFVLRNLINNALTHSGDQQTISISFAINDTHVSMAVKDQGCGIAKEYLPNIFEPFTSNKPVNNLGTKGLGLGLYLCNRIAVAHGGFLTAESKLEKGSVFTLTIPYCT
ncbi:HAMP domain-containing histidine kinase [Thalassotalea sp. HSM 43]|nr:HAMP domain-containing histidine kinase [Thalassotalea sp. HSM 43]